MAENIYLSCHCTSTLHRVLRQHVGLGLVLPCAELTLHAYIPCDQDELRCQAPIRVYTVYRQIVLYLLLQGHMQKIYWNLFNGLTELGARPSAKLFFRERRYLSGVIHVVIMQRHSSQRGKRAWHKARQSKAKQPYITIKK